MNQSRHIQVSLISSNSHHVVYDRLENTSVEKLNKSRKTS